MGNPISNSKFKLTGLALAGNGRRAPARTAAAAQGPGGADWTLARAAPPSRSLPQIIVFIVIARFLCQRQGASADKLHAKAATILHLDGLARSIPSEPSNSPTSTERSEHYNLLPPARKYSQA